MQNGPGKSALVIHANERVADFIADQLAPYGWHTRWAGTSEGALEQLRAGKWSVVFFSRTLSDGPCPSVEERLELLQPEAHIFLLTGDRTRDTEESPVRDFYGFLPLGTGAHFGDGNKLRHWAETIEERLSELSDAVVIPVEAPDSSPIIGECPRIREVRRKVDALAATNEACLVTGESGTGKLVVSHTIHDLRYGKAALLLLILCEEENEKIGTDQSLLTEVIRRGEIGTILVRQLETASEQVQAALLKLDYGSGASPSVIANSCRPLPEMVGEGRFSAELYRRLKNYINLPALRDRREDLSLLIGHFVRQHINRPSLRISRRAWKLLEGYSWPGNLPELHNATITALAHGGGATCVMDLPPEIAAGGLA